MSGAFLLGGAAWAGGSGGQTVSFQVVALNELSVSGNPGPLTVSGATPGSPLQSASEASTTLSISTNEVRKVTASLDAPMPEGLTLTLTIAAPAGANSLQNVPLDTTSSDILTGITRQAASGKTITYRLSADVTAGAVAPATRTVLLTLTN